MLAHETQSQRVSVLVVIVCYRAVELTIECLRSLEPEIRAIPRARVAVCENGTGEQAVARLARAIRDAGWQDWVMLKAIEPNCGFTGGNNAILSDAMAWAQRPEYFLLLNADTIVRPGAIRELLAASRVRPDIGIIGPRLEHPDGEPQISCFRAPTPLSEFLEAARTGPLTRLFARHELPLPVCDTIAEPDWISFACVLVRSEVIEQIGGLDDGYYLYFDDPDYCRRARAAGWGILYWPRARVVHLVGQSNPVVALTQARKRRPKYYYASRSRYFAKAYGPAGLWLANAAWTLGRAVSLLRELAGGKKPHTCAAQWRDIWTNALQPRVGWGFPSLNSEWLTIRPQAFAEQNQGT